MQQLLLALLAFTCIALPCVGQDVLAYPQDSTQTNTGQLVPLGHSSSNRNFDESRYQVMIPATHLPPAGSLLLGMEVWATSSNASVAYPSLDITLSHTTSTTLSTDFASNLPAPIPVFSAQNINLAWSSRVWTPITFQVAFPYDGVSNLVVEFRKIITPGTGSIGHGTEVRRDLPLSRHNFGILGSGASTSTTAQFATSSVLKMRLLCTAPTLLLRGDPNAPSGEEFGLGGNFDIEVRGPTGTVYALLGSAGFGPPTPFPPLLGFTHLNLAAVATLSISTIPMSGIASLNLSIPNNVGLIGTNLVFQAPLGRSILARPIWTNASNLIIQM